MTDPTIEQPLENGQAQEFQLDPVPANVVGTALADHLDALDAAIEAHPGVDSFNLPSGVRVNMMPGKGRDLLAAQRVAGDDQHQVTYALAAVLCTFDGERRVMEDVLDMPLGDVMQLMTKISAKIGGDFLSSTTAASSTSRP